MKSENTLNHTSQLPQVADTPKSTPKMATTYKLAVEWRGNSIIRCNHIFQIDNSLIENARFNMYDSDDNPIEIFQTYITDCTESDVEYLEKHFGLLFTYSDLLECYILCVDHYGTDWGYVIVETDLTAEEIKARWE